MTTNIIITIATITLTALMAGLYYGYYCSVNPGLGNLPDVDYLRAMQSINIAIQNPVFFLGFMGPIVLLPLTTYLNYNPASPIGFYLLLAASLCYIAGSIGVTALYNIPINNQLNKMNLATAAPDGVKEMALLFRTKWNFYHNIRTLSTLLSLVLLVSGTLVKAIR